MSLCTVTYPMCSGKIHIIAAFSKNDSAQKRTEITSLAEKIGAETRSDQRGMEMFQPVETESVGENEGYANRLKQKIGEELGIDVWVQARPK